MPIFLYPQEEFRFHTISLEQGLSQSSVLSITQDKYGFMWFATLDGLNKYDGYKFTIYRHDPLDPSTVSDLGIRKVFTDSRKNLWIITLSGNIDRYDYLQDHFRHYQFGDVKNNRASRIISITESPGGTLYAGGMSGALYSYNSTADSFMILKSGSESLTAEPVIHVQSLCIDDSGNIWMGTWEGLLKKSLVSGRIVSWYRTTSSQNKLRSDIQMNLAKDRTGKIWSATASGGIVCFEPSSDKFKEYYYDSRKPGSLPTNRIMSVFTDSKLNTWVGTIDAGLCLLEQDSETFLNFRSDPSNSSTVGKGAIMSFYQDNSGGIWIGTSGGGVSRFDYKKQSFHTVSFNLEDINNPPVLSLLEDRSGRLWIGTDGGGLICRDKKGRLMFFLKKPPLGSNSITSLFEDSRGTIWAATDPGTNSIAGGIYTIHRNEKDFFPFTLPDLKIGGIQCILEDRKGNIWFGSLIAGLWCYNPISKKVIHYSHIPSDKNSICGNSISTLMEDSEGNLWIGTQNTGLSCFDPMKGKFTNFYSDPYNENSLSSNSIWSLYQDENGKIWIGTWGGGLNLYDKGTLSFNTFTTKNGLPSNVICSILPGGKGNIWIATNRGLAKFNLYSRTCKNYYKSDGLQSDEFNQGAAFCSKEGLLYFGGINGINVFNPEKIEDNNYIPPVMITGFYIKNEPLMAGRAYPLLDDVRLSYEENFFSIEFAALDFSAPEKNKYSYKLSGVDKDWVTTNKIRRAFYTNISPGKYVFMLKGSNGDGIWNPAVKTLSIIITPPFWQTWWFRSMLVILFGLLLYSIHRYRLIKLLELERTRIRIAKDLHDDVSATLTGIAYFSEAISKEVGREKTPVMQKLISLIQESTEEVQEGMHDIIWSINPENDRWDVIFPKFRRYASDLCESRNISYNINFPETAQGKALAMEERRNLWLIFKELITNAVKHSECSSMDISITVERENLVLIVKDDGTGFDPSIPSERDGIKNIMSRTAALNGTANLTTSPGNGTYWKLLIPL